MGIEVRRVRADEWRELRVLRLEALRLAPEAFGATHEGESAQPDAKWRERAERGAQAEDTALFVAVDVDGAFVGLTGVFNSADKPGRAIVYAVYVQEAARGTEVASQLSRAVLEFSRSGPFDELMLDVRVENKRARRFYEREGFEYTGREWSYPHDENARLLEMRYAAFR